MLYELHLPLVMLANRQLQRGPGAPGVNPTQIKADLKVRMPFKVLDSITLVVGLTKIYFVGWSV